MKILGLGIPELAIILVVVLLIFGPKNLPKLGNALGKTMKSLREGIGAGKKIEAEETEEPVVEAAEQTIEEKPVLTEATEAAPTKKKRVVRVKNVDVDDSETVTA